MRVAVVQTNPKFGEKTHNIEQALNMMNSVPADIYVLPELFASGYNFSSFEEVQTLSEPFRNGTTFAMLSKFARDRRCYIVYGFAEQVESSVYNSACMVGYDGTVELYRKIHLFDREKLFFQPGNRGFNVYQTPFGRIGMMVCFDWHFPESARTLALKGAQLIAHPSNLVLPNCPDSMPLRCLENRVFAATANRIGVEDRKGIRFTYIGKSQITSPKGEILHRASDDTPEIFVEDVEITLADDKNVGEHNHLLRDRRPEWYV